MGSQVEGPSFHRWIMRCFVFILLALSLSGCMVQPAAESTATPLPYKTPDWFSDAVVYEIYVRSFADSDGDGVGDLDGIQSKLDYLESLEVEVLWLMPIYPSPSVHGYDVTDFFDVNPEYGTRSDLIALVEAVHERGMRLILDFVPSHLSDEHPLFVEAFANPESEKADWFVWTNETHTSYAGFADSQDMPRFNHFNPEVIDYLQQAALFWLDLDQDGDYADGVDGFRVDNVTFPPEAFFLAVRQAVKSANPEALLLGEAWLHNASDLAPFYKDKFDALFDFPIYELFQGNPGFSGDGVLAGKSFPSLIWPLMEEQRERYPIGAQSVRFFNNHDTNRIMSELEGDVDRARLVPGLLATLPGPVMLYYGEEIGMLGKKGTAPHWDSYRREPMQWWKDNAGEDQTSWFDVDDAWNQPNDGISVEEQDGSSESLLNIYRAMLSLRVTHPALQGDAIAPISVEVSGMGPWGFIRGTGEHRLIVLMNFANEARSLTLTSLPEDMSIWEDRLIAEDVYVVEDGKLTLLMAPGEFLLLEGTTSQ